MPIPKKALDKAELFDELRHGKTFKRTKKKSGKKKALAQMVAIELDHERKYGKKSKKHHKHSGRR